MGWRNLPLFFIYNMKEETIYFNSLKKIKDKVKHLLIKHPKTRDNDNELVCWFWYYECTEVNFHHKDFMPNKLSMLNFLSQYKKGLYTNSDNATNPSSGIAADTTNGRYIILKWIASSTSHRLYGARLRITKV